MAELTLKFQFQGKEPFHACRVYRVGVRKMSGRDHKQREITLETRDMLKQLSNEMNWTPCTEGDLAPILMLAMGTR